ncbi:hemicentin-2-like, partial [Cynoglossus semilaevis]|uniref:hemicentin-2-like n=1 Tax=Cynoglossus semilaevis TaxID=244447 RepID=UPI000D6268FF
MPCLVEQSWRKKSTGRSWTYQRTSASNVSLLLGLICLAETGVSACPVELSPPSVVLRHGGSVSTNCSTSEVEFRGIGWEASTGKRQQVRDNHVTWTVENLTDWKIDPLCYFNPSPGSTKKQCFLKLRVVLYQFPQNIHLRVNVSDNEMIEDRSYRFECFIPKVAPVQNLTVWWYKGDTLSDVQTLNNTVREPLDVKFHYTLTPKRHDDGVSIQCKAQMDLGPDGPMLEASSRPINVTLKYGPDIFCENIFLEGETLKNYCSVQGNPAPSVTWKKDGQLIDSNVPLTRKDTGKYNMEVNGLFNVTQEIMVHVAYGPELDCPSTYTAPEFSVNNMSCTVAGFPTPVVTWYKEYDDVELPEILTRRDSGQYTIHAVNNVSSVNVTVELIVNYSPTPIEELEDTEVEFESTAWLKCSSMGHPRPTYSWTYYRTTNVVEQNEDGVSRLLIYNATAFNKGLYTCQAQNQGGFVNKTVRVNVKGVTTECPIDITPERMITSYDSSSVVSCTPKPSAQLNLKEIYWEDKSYFRWGDNHWHHTGEWDPQPVCFAIFWGLERCKKPLNLTIYKKPASVSIQPLHNTNPLKEEEELQLQCNINSVAPAQNLYVRWYHGNTTLEPLIQGSHSFWVAGCLPGNGTNCTIGETKSPLNVSTTVTIKLNRTHSKAMFRCEAHLDLGADGPRLTPEVSDPLNITVHYKPIIDTTKLPNKVPVFRGYPEELVCDAEGHPPPKIQWLLSPGDVPHVLGKKLNVSEAGSYICIATNDVASTLHVVEVVLKEDYLPLIAGFVAGTGIVIS